MRTRHRRRTAVIGASALLVVGALTAWVTRGHQQQPSGGNDGYPATVTVATASAATGEIGPGYIGLSFESGTLNSGKFDNVGNLPQLLRNLGPAVMRFGGYSADTPAFTSISPSALAGLVRLVHATGWSVIYTENLGQFNWTRVTTEAKAVSTALGGKLFAIACGNEPDRYPHNGIRPATYSEANYLSQASVCLKAIRTGAPGVPLEGPDLSSGPGWVNAYAAQESGTVNWIGQHYYPLGCASPGQDPRAMLATMLSPALATSEAQKFDAYAPAVRTAHAGLVVSETNSACNGGIKGLSDSYASALWVISYLLTGAEHGVHSMNFHGGLDTYCSGYTPLCQAGANSYRAQPIYYGMLFTHMLGAGKLLPASVSEPAKAAKQAGKKQAGKQAAKHGDLAAFALRPSNGGAVRVMVENLSKYPADATLRISGSPASVRVLRLTGPSALATSGVRIQGAAVSAKGTIRPGRPDSAGCSSNGCPVTLAPYSAAIVTAG